MGTSGYLMLNITHNSCFVRTLFKYPITIRISIVSHDERIMKENVQICKNSKYTERHLNNETVTVNEHLVLSFRRLFLHAT